MALHLQPTTAVARSKQIQEHDDEDSGALSMLESLADSEACPCGNRNKIPTIIKKQLVDQLRAVKGDHTEADNGEQRQLVADKPSDVPKASGDDPSFSVDKRDRATSPQTESVPKIVDVPVIRNELQVHAATQFPEVEIGTECPFAFQDFYPGSINEEERRGNQKQVLRHRNLPVLLAKANMWLQEHPEFSVHSVEVITADVRCADLDASKISARFEDNFSSITCFKGLRFWLKENVNCIIKKQVIGHFYAKAPTSQTMRRDNQHKRLPDLVQELNAIAKEQKIRGKILSIVTDFSPGFGIDDPRCAEDVTSWCREFAPETQVAILRVFYEVGDEAMPQIQVVNFAPNLLKSENYYDASVPDQRGKPLSRRNLYESHTNSLAKFNEWLNRKAQSGEEITILGMQTVLQPTRAISALTSTSWEHLDAEETIFPSNLCKNTLESVKMLRVFYSGSVSDDSLSEDSRNNPRVSCRSFFPENPREDLSYELWQRATSFARDKQLKAGFLRLETVKTVVSTPEATLPMDYGSASLCFDKTANTFWVTGFVLYFYSLGGREDSLLGSVASGGEEIDVEQCVSDKKPQQHRKRFSGRCIVA